MFIFSLQILNPKVHSYSFINLIFYIFNKNLKATK